MVNHRADVDIDLANRNDLITLIKCVPAMHVVNNKIKNHNSGIYVTDIPYDPVNQCSALDFKEAENRKYFKIDLLNMSVYEQVKNEADLIELMAPPNWDLLLNREFVEQLVHIGSHFDTLLKMPQLVNTIPRLAMFLAIFRPAKRHLIGKQWSDVAKEIWTVPANGEYSFKKAHAVSYAMLVNVHMNLLTREMQ